MLKVWCLVSGFFQLILGVFSKLIPNIVNKDLRIPKILLEKDFEFWPHDWSNALVAALVLSPSKVDGTMKKRGCKWGTIHSGSTWNFKMVLTLLTKVIAIHVRFPWISFWDLVLSSFSQSSTCSQSQAWVDSTNAFINFVKKSLVGGTRGRVGASRGVEALLLPASDLFAEPWRLASSFCSPMGLAKRLLQGLRQAQDPGAIAMKIWSWFFQMGWLIHWVWSF